MNKPALIDPGSSLLVIAQEEDVSLRLDAFLAKHFPAYSRNFLQRIIDEQKVMVNEAVITKYSHTIKLHDAITITFPSRPALPDVTSPENLGVKIVYEHEHFLIVYKPAGLIVHPPHQLYEAPTLVHWLTLHFSELKEVGMVDRPGIVHRLDKDTSGILIVPRNNYAHAIFSDLFKSRHIEKTYFAVVQGHPPRAGSIHFSITRDPKHKYKMTHKQLAGREALTNYQAKEYFDSAALIEVHPVTGRTHQIRVHFAAIGHPLLGDSTYGCSSPFIDRQALHAYQLSFTFLGHQYTFWHDMPCDMRSLLQNLGKKESSTTTTCDPIVD